jgi:hypothetical protein
MRRVPLETISPELALVDPELGARARAALPDPTSGARRPLGPPPVVEASNGTAGARSRDPRPYPLWARVTAALWLLVLGILIGGAAIPHAQDKPRLIPNADEPAATICKAPTTAPSHVPTEPGQRFGFP